MKSQIGLSIIIMIFCFNLGLMIINEAGLYSGELDPEAEGAMENVGRYNTGGSFLITMLVTGSAGALGGLGLARIGGAGSIDVLRFAGITSVGTALIPLWYHSRNVMLGLADSLTAQTSGTLAYNIINIFILFQVIMVVIFIIQLATGGWLNVK